MIVLLCHVGEVPRAGGEWTKGRDALVPRCRAGGVGEWAQEPAERYPRSHPPAPGRPPGGSAAGHGAHQDQSSALRAELRAPQVPCSRGTCLPCRQERFFPCPLLPSIEMFSVELPWLTLRGRHAPQAARVASSGSSDLRIPHCGFTPKLIPRFRAPCLQESTPKVYKVSGPTDPGSASGWSLPGGSQSQLQRRTSLRKPVPVCPQSGARD